MAGGGKAVAADPGKARQVAGWWRADYGRAGLALALGAVAGALGWAAGLPLPWMLGPMIANTVAALARLPVAGPNRLRPLVIPVIGVMLGSGFTPELLSQAGRWGATLLLLPPFVVATALASYLFYRKVAGYDRVTAFFAGVPGGLNDMMILGAEAGGDEKRIALAHASRILVVVSFVVGFFGFVLGVRSPATGAVVTRGEAASGTDLLVLLACAVAGYWAGRRLRLPAAALFGPMLVSAAAHLAGAISTAPPAALVVLAQVVIGTVIGCRFAGTRARHVLRDVAYGAGSSLVMIAVALGFATLLSAWTGAPRTVSFLAFSPGGLTEMSLLALAMGQEVVYVALAHTARIAMVVAGAPMLFRLLRRPDH